MARLLARLGVALAIFAQVAFPAYAADNYDVIDAHGATKTMGAKGVGTGPTVLHGLHVLEGLNAGVPTPVNQTIAGQLDVNCVSGCSSGGTVTVQQPTAANLNATVVGSVSLTGNLPAFAATPTFNCGTGCSAGSGTAQGAASGGVTGGLSLGLVTTSAPTYTATTVNGLSLDTAGNLRVTAPAGAATSANQSTEITALNLLHTDNGSLATSALQTSANTKLDTLHTDLTGVSTAANQTTANGSLATIAGGIPDVVPSPGTITAADVGTTTIAGQGAVTLVTGTPTANSFQTWAVNGRSSLNLLVTGTFVETIQIEGSADGSVYVPISGLLRGASVTTGSITAPAVVSFEVAGFSSIRARAAAFTSGTATLTPRFSVSTGPVKITNPLPAGSNAVGSLLSPANFTPAQISCGTTATLIAAARTARQLQSVVQTSTTDVFLGGSGVTTATGHLLPGTKGASLTMPYTGALYCIVASGTATVTEAETY